MKFPYSANYSFASILVMLVLMLLLFNSVAGANSVAAWLVYGFIAGVFVFLLVMLVLKRLIPALQGRIALELNEKGLIDYIRNVTIDWKDIKEINLVRGRSSAIIRLDLKWVSDYGDHIAIPLRWVKGKDDDIYEAVMAYFEAGEIRD